MFSYKLLLQLCLPALLLAPSLLCHAQSAPAGEFILGRGVNISHWLSQSQRRDEARQAYFTAQDVAFIAGRGFDHIRLPVDEVQLWDENGDQEAEAFSLLHQALGWSREQGLRVIVDLHILRAHHFNEAEKPLWTEAAAQERFLQCWRDLSTELKTYPLDFLAYELMNEPVADDPEDWNKLVARAVALIRETEPLRKIVVGSNRWQSTETFGELRLPEGDSHLIVSFHFYEPFLLTHYQASWTNIAEYQGPVVYPGQIIPDTVWAALDPALQNKIAWTNQYFDAEKLEERILKPVLYARERGLPVYCGEWGCYEKSPEPERLRWYADVRAILEKHGVGWTIWDYKGGFGVRRRDGAPYEALLRVLLD
jgi:endoglucanase